MAKSYFTITHFVQNTDIELLEAYFKQANIPFPENLKLTNDDKKPNGVEFETYINNLDPELQYKINNNFMDINELSYEGGIFSIIEVANIVYKLDIQDELSKQNDFTNQALYCYLNHREVFNYASQVDHFDNLSTKIVIPSVFKKPVNEVHSDEIKSALENELKLYFKHKEGRGQNCIVDIIPYKDRVFYQASPQDFSKFLSVYDENNEYKRSVVKPVFEIVFIYYPNDGKLEVSASRFRTKRKNELADIFRRVVLKDERILKEGQIVYDFNKVLDTNFTMPCKLEDKVSWAYLKQITLSYRYSHTKRISLEVDDKNTDGARAIHEMIKENGLNTDQFDVSQITFKVKFEGAGNKGSVTAIIGYPSKCNLSNTTTHNKVRDYLKYWKMELDNDAGAE